ncbi:hypothetical protein PSPO01_04924 [Paraphaeosphaeria sporulosa]
MVIETPTSSIDIENITVTLMEHLYFYEEDMEKDDKDKVLFIASYMRGDIGE